jgi:glycosyltransferase involved in cell wall biosynthesis
MQKRIEILHVITRMEQGGAPRVLLDLMERLDPRAFSQTLATGPAPAGLDLLPEVRRLPVRIREIGGLVREISPVRDLPALFSLVGLIRREPFDIIHVHTSKAGFLGRLAARIAGHRQVVYSPHGDIFVGYFPKVTTLVYTSAERWAAHWCAHIVTLSDAGAREYLTRGIGKPSQFVTVYNGIDLRAVAGAADRLGARRELGWGKDDRAIVSVGRLVPVKGQDLLVSAAPAIIEGLAPRSSVVRFLVVGDGPERENLARLARRLGVGDRFSFVGLRADVPRLLSAADLMVMPSRNEGLGMSMIEAMAASLPVVGARVGGIPEVVEDNVTGTLVPPDDPGALARACVEILSDHQRARAMGGAGRKRARELFAVEKSVEIMARLYRDMMAGAS